MRKQSPNATIGRPACSLGHDPEDDLPRNTGFRVCLPSAADADADAGGSNGDGSVIVVAVVNVMVA
eukprot:14911709-Alexandrium_andersonii.AAC.1